MVKIVFMGTSGFALPSLATLFESTNEIVGVVTQPDRPRGRGKKMLPSPIKEFSLEHNLPLYQPSRIKAEEAIDTIRNWEPDIIVVVAYGQILPVEVLDIPRLGCINVHASLLPHYRGAAPIQRSLMAGDKVTGITTMFMDAGLDTGDIILQKPVDIEDEMDYGQLENILAAAGAELLMDTLAIIASGSYPRRKQDTQRSTYAPMLNREDEKINWGDAAVTIRNRIRALSPRPAAYTSFKGHRFKIFRTRLVEMEDEGIPGQVIQTLPGGFRVQTGQGVLEILEVQKEGKKRIDSSEFLKGFNLGPGDILS